MQPPNKSNGELESNGHGDPLADADTLRLEPLEWPKPRQSLLSKGLRLMSGRQAPRAAPGDGVTRQMPAWLPSVVVTIGLAVATGLIWFGSWRAGVDRDLRAVAEVANLRLEVAYLRGRVYDAEDTDTYVQMLTAYEINLREKLLPLAQRYSVQFPAFPERPRPRQRQQREFNNRSEEESPP